MTKKEIGAACKRFREIIGAAQTDVAKEINRTPMTVSAFETGRNNSARVLLWYFAHGMTYKFLYDEVKKNGEENV